MLHFSLIAELLQTIKSLLSLHMVPKSQRSVTCRIIDFASVPLSRSFVPLNPSLSESLLIPAGWFHIATPSVQHKKLTALFNHSWHSEIFVWPTTAWNSLFDNIYKSAILYIQGSLCSLVFCNVVSKETKCYDVSLMTDLTHNPRIVHRWITVSFSCP